MGDQQTVAAPFPTPPPFYKHFTKQNATRLRQARKEAGVSQTSNDSDETKRDIDITSLPPELRYLIPPPPPANGKWRSFGLELDLNPPEATLESAGIEQLYPDHPSVKLNPQAHLVTLMRSLLASFVSILGKLSQDPELADKEVPNLHTIALNAHDLINQYRPHQARETLILLMEERVEKMRAEIKAIGEAKEKVAGLLGSLQAGADAQDTSSTTKRVQDATEKEAAVTERRRAKQRAAWAALEELSGPRELDTND